MAKAALFVSLLWLLYCFEPMVATCYAVVEEVRKFLDGTGSDHAPIP